MKRPNFRRLVLMAAFAIFTIATAGINYCLAGIITKWGYERDEFCHECGLRYPDEPEIEIWYDQVFFEIHTYACPMCGSWLVYYVYPITE